MQVPATARPLPLTVITGFLGSGKTTLVNRILAQPHGRRLIVFVNEFGRVDIDAELVAAEGDGVVALRNGCICCTVSDDLDASIAWLQRQLPRPDGVILETSGVADPLPLVARFARPRDGVLLEALITVVDAEQVEEQLRSATVVEHQIAFADFLILNKVDLVSDDLLARRQGVLRQLNDGAPILRAERSGVETAPLLGAGGFDAEERLRRLAAHENAGHDHLHLDGWESVAYVGRHPLDLAALEAWVDRLPVGVVRGKGILWIEGLEQRAVLQIVGARRETLPGERWNDVERHSRLVLIGRNLNQEELLDGLRALEQRDVG